MKNVKILLNNVQMRNIIYLFLGLIISLIIIVSYKPVRESYNVISDDNVKIPKNDKLNDLLSQYKSINNVYYKIYYDEYIINGIYIDGIYYDDLYFDDVKKFEEIIEPNNLYNILYNKGFQNEYIVDNYKIKLEFKDKIDKIIVGEITIEYGG